MKTVSLVLSAAALSLTLTGTASAAHKDTRYDHRFLSQNEAIEDVMDSFRRLDRNHDGILKFHEVRRQDRYAHHSNSRYDRWYRQTGYQRFAKRVDDDITTRNFHKYDRNGDRVLTKHEVRKLTKKKFRQADLNHDGYLSYREIERSNWFDSDDHDGGRRYNDYRDYDRDRGRDNHRHRH